MPPSTVPNRVIASDLAAARRAVRAILGNRRGACEQPHRLVASGSAMLLPSQEPSDDLARDRQDIRHAMMKETPMRLCLLILVALLTAAPAIACPTGYVPCGTGNALCCR